MPKIPYVDYIPNTQTLQPSGFAKVKLFDNSLTTLPTGATTIDGVSVATNDTVLFSNLSSNNNQVYKADVVVSGGGGGGDLLEDIAGQASQFSGLGAIGAGFGYLFDQPFAASASKTLDTVIAYIRGIGTISGVATAYLYSDSSGSIGSLLATSDVASLTGFIADGTDHAVRFNFSTPYTLVSSTVYHIVIDWTTASASVGTGAPTGSGISGYIGKYATSISGPWSNLAGSGDFVMQILHGTTMVLFSNYPNSNSTIGPTPALYYSQGFISGTSWVIGQIGIISACNAACSGNALLKIYSDNAGDPDTLLAASDPLNLNIISGPIGPKAIFFKFSTPYTLASSTVYHIVLDFSGAVTAGTISVHTIYGGAINGHSMKFTGTFPGGWSTVGGPQALNIELYTTGSGPTTTTSWTAQSVFAGSANPTDGDFVVITHGTSNAEKLAQFTGSDFVLRTLT